MKKIIEVFTVLFCIAMVSCNVDAPDVPNFKSTTGLSIVVNNGKVGVSSLVNENNVVHTEYWIDDAITDTIKFHALMGPGNYYRTSIDNRYLASSVFKNAENRMVTYKFNRYYSLNQNAQLFYYKNDKLHKMDTIALGAISAVDISHGEIFAGFFGEKTYFEAGPYQAPNTPFYWEGDKKITKLPLPEKINRFSGVSCIHKSAAGDVYVGGMMDYPMYWKNKEVVKLNELYGEVNQIITVGADVYAVGFYNKRNSNSSGHTACYWKNGVIVEIEDDAIGHGIYIDGKDVYVCGAKGRVPVQYVACFWKNGKRVNLEKK